VNSRSLLPLAIALAVGIAIGFVFKPDFLESVSSQEPARSTFENSDRSDSGATAPIEIDRPDPPTRSKSERARTSVVPSTEVARQGEDEAPRDGFAPRTRVAERNAGAAHRDESFGPDVASLPFPPAIDGTRAAADYAEWGDGPLRRNATGPEDRHAGHERGTDKPEQELGTDACFPAFSACRRDTDCCGSSVCRSRPGTISGYFECTAS